MPDLLSAVLLVLLALIIIGPRRLPQGLEALWLAVIDYRRAQQGQPQLETLDNARRYWVSIKDPVFAFIELLYRISEHLEELRVRLFISFAVLAAAFVIALFFAEPLLGLLIQPLSAYPNEAGEGPITSYVLGRDVQVQAQVITPSGPQTQTITLPSGTPLPLRLPSPRPVFLRPTEIFAQYMKVAFLVALALSLPLLVWELLMFLRGPLYPAAAISGKEFRARLATMAPDQAAQFTRERADRYTGLTAQEIRPLYVLAPLALIFFVLGVLFTYFVILPNALRFLFGLGGDLVQALPALEEYIGFVVTLLLWVGVAFETPLIMFFLARFRIVKSSTFTRYWRHAVVLITVIAAVITPTVDPLNMALVMGPMIVLYALGIVFARFAGN